MTTEGNAITGITEMFTAFRTAVSLVRDVKAVLPTDDTRVTEIETSLEEAERAAKCAEAEIARKLRYRICRRHWPPEIMLHLGGRHWKCQTCGHIEEVGKPVDTIRPRRRQWGR